MITESSKQRELNRKDFAFVRGEDQIQIQIEAVLEEAPLQIWILSRTNPKKQNSFLSKFLIDHNDSRFHAADWLETGTWFLWIKQRQYKNRSWNRQISRDQITEYAEVQTIVEEQKLAEECKLAEE